MLAITAHTKLENLSNKWFIAACQPNQTKDERRKAKDNGITIKFFAWQLLTFVQLWLKKSRLLRSITASNRIASHSIYLSSRILLYRILFGIIIVSFVILIQPSRHFRWIFLWPDFINNICITNLHLCALAIVCWIPFVEKLCRCAFTLLSRKVLAEPHIPTNKRTNQPTKQQPTQGICSLKRNRIFMNHCDTHWDDKYLTVCYNNTNI